MTSFRTAERHSSVAGAACSDLDARNRNGGLGQLRLTVSRGEPTSQATTLFVGLHRDSFLFINLESKTFAKVSLGNRKERNDVKSRLCVHESEKAIRGSVASIGLFG